MKREYYCWHSPNLKRDMEMLVFGDGGPSVLFFPTRMARFFDYENWGIVGAVQDKIAKGELQLYCVDSIDSESFYNQDIHPSERIVRHLQYEQYILEEVVPRMDNTDGLIVAGCSMGAYHAASMAFRKPELFYKAVCMSGRYDLTRQIGDFRDLFDGYHNEDIYFSMPRQFVCHVHDPVNLAAMRDMEIIIAIGETDPFIDDNREFDAMLWDKGIEHQFPIWEGYAHRPRYWRQMAQLYF